MSRWGRARRPARVLSLVGAVLLAGSAAGAASVLPVSVHELLDGAELVFEGRAIGRRTAEDGGPRALRTCVRFAVIEVLKGPAVASPLELCFAGGRSKYGVTRTVMGLERPRLGEHGIYFVASTGDPYRLHPLVGWDQGRFKVDADQTVTTAGGDPVVALDGGEDAATQRGAARGARVAAREARGSAPAMDASAFKARLRQLMAEGN